MIRTHDAGSLRAENVGETVTLAGWVARRRDHGGVAFIDLREASGVVQVVIRDEAVAHQLRSEYCLKVTGEVSARPEGNQNAQLPTGDVEVIAAADGGVEVLSAAAALPFPIDEHVEVGEEVRLAHRYLDLRRSGPAAALRLRSEVNRVAREVLARRGLRRDRDPDADPVDPRGRPRLPGAGAAAARQLVRPAAEPAAVQAAADGRRHGALLPDRALLPRRGLPRRPAAGVHPARRRDELRRGGRRHRAGRGRAARRLEARRARRGAADRADDLRRGDGALRHRQARPAALARAHRVHRLLQGHPVPGVPGAVRRRGRDARRGQPAAPAVRRLAGVGQAARRQGPGLRDRPGRRRARRPGREEPRRGGEGRAGRARRREAGGLRVLRRRAPPSPAGRCSARPASRSGAAAG